MATGVQHHLEVTMQRHLLENQEQDARFVTRFGDFLIRIDNKPERQNDPRIDIFTSYIALRPHQRENMGSLVPNKFHTCSTRGQGHILLYKFDP